MPYCAHCGKQITEDINFCPECGQPTTQYNKETVATSAHAEISDMSYNKHKNWFERHLNWTMIFTWICILVIAVTVGMFM